MSNLPKVWWPFPPNTPYQAALSWGQGTASCALFCTPQKLSTRPHQGDQELVMASRMAAGVKMPISTCSASVK